MEKFSIQKLQVKYNTLTVDMRNQIKNGNPALFLRISLKKKNMNYKLN